jgi:hypothetical protein
LHLARVSCFIGFRTIQWLATFYHFWTIRQHYFGNQMTTSPVINSAL